MSTAARQVGVLLTALLVAVSPWASNACASEAVDEAVNWVEELPSNRVYTDGYRIHETPSLLTPEGQDRMTPVVVLEYYQRAWETFLAQPDLSELQRQPRHYKIGHELDDEILSVVIQGLLLPRIVDGEPQGYLRVSAGPSMRLRYRLSTGELLGTELLR